MRLSMCVLGWALLATVAAPAPAIAGPPEARQLYDEGELLFREGRFVEAGRKFEAAFVQDPDHAYLYNAGFAYEKGGDLPSALRLYGRFVGFSQSGDVVDRVHETIQGLETKLLETRARIGVESTPPGASLAVSGLLESDKTPTTLWLKPGRYTLEISAEGHLPSSRELTVGAGDREALTVALEAAPGALEIRTEPAGATITLDGEAVGKSPVLREGLSAGAHRLRVEAPGYVSLDQAIQVRPGKLTRLELTLAPIRSLTAAAPPEEPLASKWWFWTAIGGAALVVGGVVTAIVLTLPEDPALPGAHAQHNLP